MFWEVFKNMLKILKVKLRKGIIFLQWVLTRVFEATEDDAADAIVDGANDLGIDAYLPVDFSDNTIRLFQSKYGHITFTRSNCQIQRRCKTIICKRCNKNETGISSTCYKNKRKKS
jgi:hypothetical protein